MRSSWSCRASWLSALLVVCACGDDTDEGAAETAAALPAADAVEVIDEPTIEPEVEPIPEPGVVLLEAGRGSKEALAWQPEVGTPRRLVMGVRVNTRTGDEPAPLSPRLRMEIDANIDAVEADGSIRRAFEIQGIEIEDDDRVDDEAIEAMRSTMEPLRGKKGVVDSDAFGSATDLAVAGATAVDPRVSKFVASLRHAWSHLTIPLPAEPVGPGAKWTATRRIDLQGIDAWQIATYTLIKREGRQIELKGEITYRLAEPDRPPVGFDGIELLKTVVAQGTLEARLDLATATPIEAHIGLAATFEAQGEGDTPIGGKIGIDITIDEDWLARADDRVELRGRFAQGGLVWGTAAPDTKVWFNKKRIDVSEDGDFLIGFGRDADRKALLSFSFVGEPTERHVVFVEARHFETESIDGLPDEMVNVPKEAQRTMAAARKVISKHRAKSTRTAWYRSGFKMPLRGRITSTYGRPRILNGKDSGHHWGVDIAAPVGKPVKAPASGKVVYAQNDLPLPGTILMIDHGFGLTSSFLHLAKIKVAVGDEVKRGQTIATVGNTGRTTGPHLDWRMNLFDTRIDPQLVLEW
jgi:biotin carboxyl carrier protein